MKQRTAKIIIFNKNKILILKRSSKAKNNPQIWEIPGGKVDKNENFQQGAIREVREETALDIKIIGELYHENAFRRERFIFYATTNQENIILYHEHKDYDWILPENLETINLVDKELIIYILRNNLS